jgi:hypothetical protein
VQRGHRFVDAVCLCAVLALLAWAWAPEADEEAQVALTPAAPAPPAPAPAPAQATVRPSPGTAPPKSQAIRNSPSRADDIDRLLASGRPEDAFAAYNVVQACLRARHIEAQLPRAEAPETRLWME